jgi:hypothetical protein
MQRSRRGDDDRSARRLSRCAFYGLQFISVSDVRYPWSHGVDSFQTKLSLLSVASFRFLDCDCVVGVCNGAYLLHSDAGPMAGCCDPDLVVVIGSSTSTSGCGSGSGFEGNDSGRIASVRDLCEAWASLLPFRWLLSSPLPTLSSFADCSNSGAATLSLDGFPPWLLRSAEFGCEPVDLLYFSFFPFGCILTRYPHNRPTPAFSNSQSLRLYRITSLRVLRAAAFRRSATPSASRVCTMCCCDTPAARSGAAHSRENGHRGLDLSRVHAVVEPSIPTLDGRDADIDGVFIYI